MKDIFKKIVRPLDLREYAAEMETEILVWVNPPRALLIENAGLAAAVGAIRDELRALTVDTGEEEKARSRGAELARRLNEIGAEQAQILSQLWSQGTDPAAHWSTEEILDLATRCMETDPALYLWLRERTFQMIADHRAGQKKA